MKSYLSLKEYSRSVLQNLRMCFKKSVDLPLYCIAGCKNLELENIENLELLVQIVGKREIFRISPKELYVDDSLINGFSKVEVRTITILGLIQEKKYNISTVELESIKYSMGKQMATFSFKVTGEKIEKDINELPKCRSLISRLTPIEAFRLGMSYEDQRQN